MHFTLALTTIAIGTLVSAAPRRIERRQSDCKYYPNQTEPIEMSSPAYILRVESMATNATLGYLDAYSTDYAVTADRASASMGFNAPDWNTNQALIFWNGDRTTERGLNLEQEELKTDNTTVQPVLTQGCGTRTTGLADKYDVDPGACEQAGKHVTASTGCPAWGTHNYGTAHCTPQTFLGRHRFLTGLQQDPRLTLTSL